MFSMGRHWGYRLNAAVTGRSGRCGRCFSGCLLTSAHVQARWQADASPKAACPDGGTGRTIAACFARAPRFDISDSLGAHHCAGRSGSYCGLADPRRTAKIRDQQRLVKKWLECRGKPFVATGLKEAVSASTFGQIHSLSQVPLGRFAGLGLPSSGSITSARRGLLVCHLRP